MDPPANNDINWEAVHEFSGTDEGPSEGELVKDALLCCGGATTEGAFLRLNAETREFELKDGIDAQEDHRFILPQICQPGVHYRNMSSWLQPLLDQGQTSGSFESYTLLAFCTALRSELSFYQMHLSDLASQATGDPIPWDKGQWQNTVANWRLGLGSQDAVPSMSAASGESSSSLETAQPVGGERFTSAAPQIQSRGRGPLTLGILRQELRLWHDILKKLDDLVQDVKDKSGGFLLEALHQRVNWGDLVVSPIKQRLVMKSLRPLVERALKWVCEGVLNPDDKDIFIAPRTEKGARVSVGGTRIEAELWHHGFRFISESVPCSVIPMELASAVFRTGKSVHFLIHACHDGTEAWKLAKEARERAEEEVKQGHTHGTPKVFRQHVLRLRAVEAAVSSKVEKRLLELMRSRFALFTQCQLLKQYVLLYRGDYAEALIKGSAQELDRSSRSVSHNTLSGALETAIQSSQPSQEELRHLNRLRVRLLPDTKPNSKGWDVFCLEYVVDAPLTAVFTRECQLKYRAVSTLLLQLRKSEMLLFSAGMRLRDLEARVRMDLQTKMEEERRGVVGYESFHSGVNVRGPMQGRRPVSKWAGTLRHASGVHRSMDFLFKCLQGYALQGVIASAWHHFMTLAEAATCLEDVVCAQHSYIGRIHRECFLGQGDLERETLSAVMLLLGLPDQLHESINALKEAVLKQADGRSAGRPEELLDEVLNRAVDAGRGVPVMEAQVQLLLDMVKGVEESVAKCSDRLLSCALRLSDAQAESGVREFSGIINYSLANLVLQLGELERERA